MPRFNGMHLVITQDMVTCINMEEKLVLKNLLKNRMSISSAAISPKLKNYSRVILMIHGHAVFIEPNPYVRCDTTMSLSTHIYCYPSKYVYGHCSVLPCTMMTV